MALRKELVRLREQIARRLYQGISAVVDDAAERYREAVAEPARFSRGPDGKLTWERSKPGEYPRLETGQGQENIDSESFVTNRGAYGGFGVVGAYGGVGPYERTKSDIPGHHQAGGYHLAILAGAPEEGFRSSFAEGKRLGPHDLFKANLDELKAVFITYASGALKPDASGVTDQSEEIPF